MPSVRLGKYRLNVPKNRIARTALGSALIGGGCVAFLPLFGLWMIPAGMLVLAVDSPTVRRWNRRSTVAVVRRWNARRGKTRARAPNPTGGDLA